MTYAVPGIVASQGEAAPAGPPDPGGSDFGPTMVVFVESGGTRPMTAYDVGDIGDMATWTKLSDPAVAPIGDGNPRAVEFVHGGGVFVLSGSAGDASTFVDRYLMPSFRHFSPVLPDFPDDNSRALRMSPDGTLLAIGSNDSPFIFVFELDGEGWTKKTDPTTIPEGVTSDVAWSPDSTQLAVTTNNPATSSDPSVIVYNVSDMSVAQTIVTAQETARGCDWSTDGTMLAVTLGGPGGNSTYLQVFDTSDWSERAIAGTQPPNWSESCKFSKDSRVLAVGNIEDTETLVVYDTSDFSRITVTEQIAGITQITEVQWSPNDNYLLCMYNDGGAGTTPFFAVYDTGTWTLLDDSGLTTTPSDITNDVGFTPHVWSNMDVDEGSSSNFSANADGSYQPSGGDMTIVTSPVTVPVVPNFVVGTVEVANVGSATPNTDFTVEVSRDGGTTWSTVTITRIGTTEPKAQATNPQAYRFKVDVTGQPSGTSVMLRFQEIGTDDVWYVDSNLSGQPD